MPIQIPKEKKKHVLQSIKRYFEENMESDIGDLKATLLLDFCVKEIGPIIYNQAVVDAQARLTENVTDLDVSLYQQEFTYWKR